MESAIICHRTKRDTVEIIDVEDVPLQYYPGNTNRVKVKAAGELIS